MKNLTYGKKTKRSIVTDKNVEYINYNKYTGIKEIKTDMELEMEGFKIKKNHVVMFDGDGLLIKIATSICERENDRYVIVFTRGRKEWLKTSYDIDRFESDFGKNLLHKLEQADDKYKPSKKELDAYESMIVQSGFVLDNLTPIFYGRCEELVNLIDKVKRYNNLANTRIKIPMDILCWDRCKSFSIKTNSVVGGLPLYEDVEIELDFIKNVLEDDKYLDYREPLKDIAFNNFTDTMTRFISVVQNKKRR